MDRGQPFHAARGKLEDAREALKNLKAAKHAALCREAFNSFLAHARAVTLALQAQGSAFPWFATWYRAKREEMSKDELLRFMLDARNTNLHTGEHPLRFWAEASRLGPISVVIPDGEVYESYEVTFDSEEGLYATLDPDTPRERKVPVDAQGDHDIGPLKVWISNPPTIHLGIKLTTDSPIDLCELALRYFEELLFEASERFRLEASE